MLPSNYRPAGSESDDDYDSEIGEFSFGDEDIRKQSQHNRFNYKEDVSPEKQLYDAVCNGNLDEMIELISEISFHINNRVNYDTSLLHYACRYSHVDIVSYLLEQNANPNLEIESKTPIMEACSPLSKLIKTFSKNLESEDKQNEENIVKIVKLLLDYKADINVGDKFGKTAIMYACESNCLDIVKLLISDVSLEASNSEGKTIIFFAIENNCIDIVKYLIEYGINCDVLDIKGYKPIDVALDRGFNDIYDILPKPIMPYQVPQTFLQYNNLHDYIPRIFLKTEIPEYFQEVYAILKEINMSQFVEKFELAKINLADFLTITDDRLEEIGIEYPFQRNRILFGLLYFHLHHNKEIDRVKKNERDSFEDVLLFAANHLRNLITINSTIKYVQQNLIANQFGDVDLKAIHTLHETNKKYREILLNLQSTVKYLHSFSPDKPPLYIEYGLKKKSTNYKSYLKYSIMVGISIVIYIQVKKFIFF